MRSFSCPTGKAFKRHRHNRLGIDLTHIHTLLSIQTEAIKQAFGLLAGCVFYYSFVATECGTSATIKTYAHSWGRTTFCCLHTKKPPKVRFTLTTQPPGARVTKTQAEPFQGRALSRILPDKRSAVTFFQWLTPPSSVIYLFVSTQLSIWLWFILPLAEEKRGGKDIKWLWHPRYYL